MVAIISPTVRPRNPLQRQTKLRPVLLPRETPRITIPIPSSSPEHHYTHRSTHQEIYTLQAFFSSKYPDICPDLLLSTDRVYHPVGLRCKPHRTRGNEVENHAGGEDGLGISSCLNCSARPAIPSKSSLTGREKKKAKEGQERTIDIAGTP